MVLGKWVSVSYVCLKYVTVMVFRISAEKMFVGRALPRPQIERFSDVLAPVLDRLVKLFVSFSSLASTVCDVCTRVVIYPHLINQFSCDG